MPCLRCPQSSQQIPSWFGLVVGFILHPGTPRIYATKVDQFTGAFVKSLTFGPPPPNRTEPFGPTKAEPSKNRNEPRTKPLPPGAGSWPASPPAHWRCRRTCPGGQESSERGLARRSEPGKSSGRKIQIPMASIFRDSTSRLEGFLGEPKVYLPRSRADHRTGQ